jgi:hypothetical protein
MLLARGDRSGGLAVATTQPIFSLFVEGAVTNTRLLSSFSGTFVAGQTAQNLTLNSGVSTTAGAFFQYNTAVVAPVHMKAPLLMRLRARVTQWNIANSSADYGFANVSSSLGTTANLNGWYWRMDASGVVPVVAINGAVVLTGTDVSSQLNTTNFYHWGILKDDDSVTFTIQDSTNGRAISRQVLQIPAGQAKAMLASHAQPYIRIFHGASTPASAVQMLVSEWTLGMLDTNMNLTQSQLATGLGLGSESGPTNFTTTSSLANSNHHRTNQ